ncbi:hypothetical protein [Verrucomicrobium spinosum]|uniref:hypothetical protein n=1 Tax=Verrucomicrobium spinosum TaxID=2736 RepID=UPI000AB988E7|nr:hypothetical protein [Verrucomicrobium spinosum]
MPRSFNYAVFVVMAFFFACFFLMPIWSTLEVAFLGVKGQFTLDYLAGIFRSPMYREGLANASSSECGPPWAACCSPCHSRCFTTALNTRERMSSMG